MSVFFNSHENFTCIIHDVTCILLSVTVQDVESTLQDVETKGYPVNLTEFSYWIFFIRITHLK